MISLRLRYILAGVLFCALILGGSFFAAGGSEPIEVIAHGDQVDIKKHLVRGKITIVDFYADWCGPCKRITPWLEELTKNDPQIVLRKVDIINWGSPVTKQFKIDGIPYIQVYNRKGELVGDVAGLDPQTVQQFIAKAKM